MVQSQNKSDIINVSSNESNNKKSSDVLTSDHPRIEELRQRMLAYAQENPESFHEADVKLLQETKLWLNRFLNFRGQSFEQAFQHAVKTFRWRKEFEFSLKVGRIDLSIVPLEGWLAGAMFIYLPDKEGSLMMYLRARMHYRVEPQFYRLLQQLIIFNFQIIDEIADREFGWSVLLDLNGIGWANVDLEMVYFLLNTMRYNFPNGCKRIIVYGLPWFLNMLAKTVIAALPADTKAKIRFVSGYTLPDIEPEDIVNYCEDVNQNRRYVRTQKMNSDSNSNNGSNDINGNQEISSNNKTDHTFLNGTSLNNTHVQQHLSDEEIINQLQNKDLFEFIDRQNLPEFLGGTADLNYRACPYGALRADIILREKFNYTEEKIKVTLKPFRKIIERSMSLHSVFEREKYAYKWNTYDEQCKRIAKYCLKSDK